MRSLLLVPADSPARLAEALASGADVLIVDLGDSAAAARPAAHEFLATAAKASDRPRLFVRIHALDSTLADADLDAVMPAAPEAIILPKALAGADVQHLGVKLAVREAQNALADGATRIVVIAPGSAASIFAMASYAGASRRLLAIAWIAEDLAAELGAESCRLADGGYTPPFLLARALTLFAAAAADVPAIDAITPNFDLARLRIECEAARRDGFTAKMTVDPRHVPVINEVFTPSPEAIARAHAIVAGFAADPIARVVRIGGEIVERAHLKRAERTLARAACRKA